MEVNVLVFHPGAGLVLLGLVRLVLGAALIIGVLYLLMKLARLAEAMTEAKRALTRSGHISDAVRVFDNISSRIIGGCFPPFFHFYYSGYLRLHELFDSIRGFVDHFDRRQEYCSEVPRSIGLIES